MTLDSSMKLSATCQGNQPIIHTFLHAGSQNSILGKQPSEPYNNPTHNWSQRIRTWFVHDTVPDFATLKANYRQIKEHKPWHGMPCRNAWQEFLHWGAERWHFPPMMQGRRLRRWGSEKRIEVELESMVEGEERESERWRIRRSTTIFAI